MEKKSVLVLRWLKDRRQTVLYFMLHSAVILVIYKQYRLPWDIVGYTLLFGGCIGFLFLAADCVRMLVHYKALKKMPGRFPTGKLPPPVSLVEEEYQEIIHKLEEERVRLNNEADLRRKDSGEYYTLWVHQVKTPLSAMRLLLQQNGEEMPPGLRPNMEQELYRIEQYTDMALQYQRLASPQTDFVFETHTMEKLAKKALINTATLFIGKGRAVKCGPFCGSLVTDEKWFCFILEQLLTNAVKYSSGGPVELYSENENTLLVRDYGTGISPEDLPRVFERGYTGHTGRKNARATGIGLYLCKQAAQKIGISIKISSEQGKGTTVRLVKKAEDISFD